VLAIANCVYFVCQAVRWCRWWWWW